MSNKNKAPKFECCLCDKTFEGYGNNPAPVKNEGLCCNKCNWDIVIPARLRQSNRLQAEWRLSHDR